MLSIPMKRLHHLLVRLFAFLALAVAVRAQLVNLATSGTASSSSADYGTIAADGNDGNRDGAYGNGSVFHTSNEAAQSFWQVQLPGVRYLDHIRIFNRTDAIQGSVGNFRIIAKNGATTVFNQVFLPSNATDNNNSRAWGTSALRGVQADFVRIERVSQAVPGVNFLTFAEFEVWGTTTAPDPLITPASINASPGGFSTVAADANDGDINGNYNGPGFPIYHSLSSAVGQFWEMTLPTDYLVKSLLIFNRCEAITTTVVKVSVLDAGGATVWTQNVDITLGAASPYKFGFSLAPNAGGRKVRIETVNSEFLTLAEVQAFGTPLVVGPPVVVNSAASGIGASTATLAANVTSTGFQNPNVKIYYGTADGGTTPGNWASFVDIGAQGGAASAAVSGLTQNTTYFFRAFAQNSGGTDWADSSATFTTAAGIAATLETGAATGITGYTAGLNGRVNSIGNDQPVVTLYWGTTDGGTSAGAWASSASLGLQSSSFGGLANNLAPSTTYFFRAAAANAAGTTWTPTQSFTTTNKTPVVINEIFYKPSDRTKDSQFIELWNPSASAVDVSGWRFVNAVDFLFPASTTIPAGGYVVIAANSAVFQATYGFAPLGQWTGELKKSGETIELRDASNVKVDDVDFSEGFPWPTSAAGAGPSIELIHPSLENDLGGAWRSSTKTPLPQTPGAVNSAFAGIAPPAIRDVLHTPNQPLAGQVVVVTARITDANGVASATLQTQTVDPGSYIRKTDAAYATSWTSTAMNDAGTNGDVLAGDGIFSATIPTATQTHRRVVRYRISSTDALGASVTAPYADDEQPNFAYFVYNGLPAWSGALQPGAGGARGTVQTYPATMLAQYEPWHLIANNTDVDNSQYNGGFNDVRFSATLVYDGKVYDHIQFKNRGKGSIYVSGKNKWALFFNRARDIRVKDNWGRYYEPWNSVALDANASPWCAVHRGGAGVEEALSYRMFELGGLPALRTNYVHWRVIDGAAESGATQYDGDMWGLYLALEPMEGNYLDERNLPDGNVYNIEGGLGDKTRQGATHPTDASDWNTFRDGANAGGQTETWYRQNMDLRALYTFFALNRLNGNVDIRAGDNLRFYHNPTNINGGTNGHWVVAPYDLDMMFVCGHHWAANIDGNVYSGVTDQFRAITRHAALGLEFRNRARELLDLMASDSSANGGQVGQLIDEYAQLVSPTGATHTWAALDAAMWNLHPRTQGDGVTASGYTSHKNNFFRTPYNDFRGANVAQTNYNRTLSDPDADGYSDFNGLMTWFRNYATNTWTGGTWTRSNGNQNGYGYKYLEWESLYGGLGLNPTTPDLSFPNTPAITYTGPINFPANALDFRSSAFSASASGGTTFAAIQWRIGEIAAPGIPGYTAGEPRKYEVEDVWTSAEIAPFNATARVPVAYAKPGSTYRARVRHKDANGRWSHWSAPVQFTVGVPDVSVYQQSLVISEVNYNPTPASQAEINAGFSSDSFEWIEVRNVSALAVDMTDVRFTKGVDFDFPAGWTIPAGGYALVVKNVAAFQSRYGTGLNALIAGSYGGDNLRNEGEEIKLSYGAGTEIRSVPYLPIAPWPIAPSGNGATLVLIAPMILPDHTAPTNWRGSLVTGGTPGASDATTFTGTATADADGDGLNALLEYGLATSDTNSAQGRTAFSLTPFGSGFDFTYQRPIAVDDITYTIQASTDLAAPWSAAAATLISRTIVTTGIRSETYRITPPVGATKFFVRLRIAK